jgi:hypothetical protein
MFLFPFHFSVHVFRLSVFTRDQSLQHEKWKNLTGRQLGCGKPFSIGALACQPMAEFEGAKRYATTGRVGKTNESSTALY